MLSRKYSINRHSGEPRPAARRFSFGEPSLNGKQTKKPVFSALYFFGRHHVVSTLINAVWTPVALVNMAGALLYLFLAPSAGAAAPGPRTHPQRLHSVSYTTLLAPAYLLHICSIDMAQC